MAKRGRAAGGGRKPRGDFSGLTSSISIRMPADMRTQLQKAANANGRSVSQELLRRVQEGFHSERDRDRDPAMRALCFLIAQLACEVSGFITEDGTPVYDWRTTPFFFRAFKLAVGQLLDAIEPKGEICAPAFVEDTEANYLSVSLFTSFQSPEARASVAAETVLRLLHRTKFPEMPKSLHKRYLSGEADGYQSAQRDLRIASRQDHVVHENPLTRYSDVNRAMLVGAFVRGELFHQPEHDADRVAAHNPPPEKQGE